VINTKFQAGGPRAGLISGGVVPARVRGGWKGGWRGWQSPPCPARPADRPQGGGNERFQRLPAHPGERSGLFYWSIRRAGSGQRFSPSGIAIMRNP